MKHTYWIPNMVRRLVNIKSDGKCSHCGREANSVKQDRWGILHFKDENGIPFELDHLIPRRSGGSSDTANLVLSCRKCNRTKKRIMLDHEEDTKKILNRFNLPTKQQ